MFEQWRPAAVDNLKLNNLADDTQGQQLCGVDDLNAKCTVTGMLELEVLVGLKLQCQLTQMVILSSCSGHSCVCVLTDVLKNASVSEMLLCLVTGFFLSCSGYGNSCNRILQVNPSSYFNNPFCMQPRGARTHRECTIWRGIL